MNKIKTILVAAMLLLGFSVVSANQAEEIQRLDCIIKMYNSDVGEDVISTNTSKDLYNDYVIPLLKDEKFKTLLNKYKSESVNYVGKSFADLAEIGYLVTIREFFINKKPSYNNKKIDKGLDEINEIIQSKIVAVDIPDEYANDFESFTDYIEKYASSIDEENADVYTDILMLYFSEFDTVKVSIDNYFKSENIKAVISFVSSKAIENGRAKDLEYKTKDVTITELLRDISIKCFIIEIA